MKRDPNLFEAFKDVTWKPSPDPAPRQPRAPRPAWTGPNPRLLVFLVLGLGLVFAAGYFAGGGRGEVAAKEEPGTSPEPTSSWQPAGPALVDPPPVAEPSLKSSVSAASGLYNAENQYTVLAITYTDVPSLQERAKSIAEFLRRQGLPAFEPVARAGKIKILVGAAETQGALQELTAKLRGTRGPTGRSFDFQSAFVVNIDDYLDRD